ncbi:MAG: hypothetical protein WCI47_03330, partial [bacterium]
FTEGSFSGIFSKQSNVKLDNRFVVFNIRDLEDELRPVGMFIALNYIWNRIKTDQKKRILAVDEAWQLMQYPDSAQFLFSIAKRCRKYFTGLTTISQDVEDFLQSRLGRAVVNNSSLQLLLKQSPAAVDMISQTFKLTSEESARLSQFPVGEGLFFVGLNHVVIRILASPMEEQLITTNPHDILERQMKAESDALDEVAAEGAEVINNYGEKSPGQLPAEAPLIAPEYTPEAPQEAEVAPAASSGQMQSGQEYSPAVSEMDN